MESPPLKNPDHGSKAPAVLVTLKGSAQQPLFARTDEVARSGSKGSHNDENVHRPPQSHDPLLMLTQGVAEAAVTSNPTHFIQVPPLTSSPTRIVDLSATSVGPGFSLGDLDAIATGQVAQEDHSTVKAKVSSSKLMQRKKLTTPASAPSAPPLTAPPGNGTGSTPPSGEEPQGL